jgi:hypothetical protein
MAPWGEEGSVVRGQGFLLVARVRRGRERRARMGFFVGCKSWERKRALCENGVFCWLQEWGEEKRVLGGRGIFMARKPIQGLFAFMGFNSAGIIDISRNL